MNLIEFKPLIDVLVNNLAGKEYDKIEQNKQNGNIPMSHLIKRITETEDKIVSLPFDWIKEALVYNIDDKRLDVYLSLWTTNGKSDLTLSLSCFYINNVPRIEINDL